ncbi:MAG TPA: nuclear transport factor 2 family protein [Candidatus Eremiobacteraceae bacterium]|nr:nuclear transport factor 2 family protein [Candidatus Eremiobacteraceae bacterium]
MLSILLSLLVAIVANKPVDAQASPSPASDRAAIINFENAVVKADASGDISFYENNLTDDWTGGTSWGTWYTKAALLHDLRNRTNNHVNKSTISGLRVRLYGDAAIATFDQSYDAVVLGQRRIRHVLNTDTFVRQNHRWMLAASHTSVAR